MRNPNSKSFLQHLKVAVLSASPTCSAALFSAVLGRLEESGLSEVSERDEGLLEGSGDSGWCRSEWPDTAACRDTQTARARQDRAQA